MTLERAGRLFPSLGSHMGGYEEATGLAFGIILDCVIIFSVQPS